MEVKLCSHTDLEFSRARLVLEEATDVFTLKMEVSARRWDCAGSSDTVMVYEGLQSHLGGLWDMAVQKSSSCLWS